MVQEYTDPYDLVVVGAGVAGIIVAAKIAQQGVNPKTGGPLRMALLERGPYSERGSPAWIWSSTAPADVYQYYD